MSVPRSLPVCVALIVLALGWATDAEAATANVTYLTSSSVYVDAGQRDGLVAGVRLRADTEGGAVVLESFEATAHRAVCKVVDGPGDALRVGSRAEFTPVVAPATVTGVSTRGPGVLARSGVHGRVGLRYLATRDGLNERTEFRQPAIDLRLDGPALFDSPWSFHADIRTRRTTRSDSDGADDSDTRSRVYRMAMGWDRPGEGWRFSLGRQLLPDLANVSVFDGVSAGYDAGRWSTGLFAGTQPDGKDYGHSSDVSEYGAFFGWRAGPESEHRWSLTTGAVASYEDSEINREYVFLHGRYVAKRFSTLLTQEIDFNRGWKKDAGESSIESTSTFASVRVTVTDSFSLVAGLDNRRDVRLFRDRVTPVTEFDDDFRRGAWLGGNVRVGDHVRLGFSGRTNRGGEAGDADSYTATAGLVRLTRWDVDVGLRATRYENDRLEGWLYAVDASVDLGSRVRLGIQGGLRDDTSLINSDLDDSVTWYGIDLDVRLARRLYATLSAERSDGDFEEVDQLYAALAWRF